MPSHLSSLLVSDGVVSVKRMERAFQRQVIYGGSLDTILLEMGLVPEERLMQYLAKVTGLPPATREETEAADPDAVARCPLEVARMYHVVPLCVAEGALRILVHDPVDMSTLEALANELELPVQPLVVPEYRFRLVSARVFGDTPDARFLTLERRAEEIKPSQPVGKAQTIIVEATAAGSASARVSPPAPAAPQATPPQATPEVAPRAPSTPVPVLLEEPESSERRVVDPDAPPRRREKRTMEMATAALARRTEESGRVHMGQAPTVPRLASPELDAASPEPDHERGAAGAAMPPSVMPSAKEVIAHQDTAPIGTVRAPVDQQPVASDGEAAPARAREEARDDAHTQARDDAREPDRAEAPGEGQGAFLSRIQLVPRGTTAKPEAPELPTGPLLPAEAGSALAGADDRDQIFNLFLRAIRYHARYAGLFTVQGSSAIGRVAIDGERIDRADVARVVISLGTDSPFGAVARSAAPYLGPLSPDPGGDAAMYRPVDPKLVQTLVYLGCRPGTAALLLPVVLRGRVVGMALGHSGDEPVAPEAVPPLLLVAGQTAEAISRLIVKSKAQQSGPVDTRGAAGAEPGNEPNTEEIPPPIDSVLSAVQSEDADVAALARSAALARPAEALAALGAHFPGVLRVERYELEGRTIAAAEHGPLLGLAVALGAAASDLLVAKMRDHDREVRYYAVLCAGEIRPPGAADALVERLFDSDYGIRSIAIDALSGYVQGARDQALGSVREALRGDDPGRVQAAANALAKLGDAAAVPVLIDVLEAGDSGAEHARRALIKLTKQDCGASARKWRGWWSKHRDQHRVEWLIAALGHKDDNLRSAAVEELRQLTGEYFGFHHDLPRKEREQAQQRWLDWWTATGRARFAAGQPGSR